MIGYGVHICLNPNNRRVVDVADQIMTGAVFLYRIQSLKIQGLQIPNYYSQYRPFRSTLLEM